MIHQQVDMFQEETHEIVFNLVEKLPKLNNLQTDKAIVTKFNVTYPYRFIILKVPRIKYR